MNHSPAGYPGGESDPMRRIIDGISVAASQPSATPHIIIPGRASIGSPDIHPFTAEGETVRDIQEKFETDFEGWQPGDIIRSRFRVRRNADDRLELVPTYQLVSEGAADKFVLSDIAPESAELIGSVGAAEVIADVRVTAPSEDITIGYTHNDAQIEAVHEVQKPFDGDFESLEAHQPVLAVGEVIGIDSAASAGHIALRLASGKTVSIRNVFHVDEIGGGVLGGVLDVFAPPGPQPGDIIQVQSSFDGSELCIAPTDPIYLMYPARERAAAYARQRQIVQAELSNLQAAATPDELQRGIRGLVGGTRLSAGTDQAYKSSMTPAEVSQLQAIATLGIDGEPHYLPSNVAFALSHEAVTGVDLIGRRESEVLALARDLPDRLLADPAAPSESSSDMLDVIYDILPSEPEWGQVIAGWLHQSFASPNHPWLHGQERQSYDAVLWMVRHSFQVLHNYVEPQQALDVTQSMYSCLQEANTPEGSNGSAAQADLVRFVNDCLLANAERVGGDIVAIRDEAVFQQYRQLLPLLEAGADNSGDVTMIERAAKCRSTIDRLLPFIQN